MLGGLINRENMDSLKVLLVGPYPPPFGGMATHIKNLQTNLTANGIDAHVLSSNEVEKWTNRVWHEKLNLIWVFEKGIRLNFDLIHYHATAYNLKGLFAFGLLAKIGKPVLITLHSFRLDNYKFSTLLRPLVRLALSSFPIIICVGTELANQIIQIGINRAKIKVVSPYLPSINDSIHSTNIPKELELFIKHHSPIISACASKLVFYQNHDLYGMDLCVSLVKELFTEMPNIGFIFSLSQIGNQVYFDQIMNEVQSNGLQNNFYVQISSDYIPVIQKSSLVIRTTNTDSYGLSVMEALEVGIPVIASDVCTRPKGTILFKSRDLDDLTAKVREVLMMPDKLRENPRRAYESDEINEIIKIYNDMTLLHPHSLTR